MIILISNIITLFKINKDLNLVTKKISYTHKHKHKATLFSYTGNCIETIESNCIRKIQLNCHKP